GLVGTGCARQRCQGGAEGLAHLLGELEGDEAAAHASWTEAARATRCAPWRARQRRLAAESASAFERKCCARAAAAARPRRRCARGPRVFADCRRRAPRCR